MTVRIYATLAAVALLLSLVPSVAAYTAEPKAERCADMTREINELRTPADLRGYSLLCSVAATRAYRMAVGLDPFDHSGLWRVINALVRSGICWVQVGEVIGWRSIPGDSTYWAAAWRASSRHWPYLNDSRYTRGGGYYTATASGYTVAVYYVLDLC